MSDSAVKKSKGAVFASRLLSTVALWAVVIGVFVSGNPWAFVALVLFLAFGGMAEFQAMFKTVPGAGSRMIGLVLGGIVMLVLGTNFAMGGSANFPDFSLEMAGLVFSLILGASWRFRHGIAGRESVDALSSGVLAYVYIPILFGVFMLRLLFEAPGSVAVPGAWLVLLMIASAKFTDMGAYATGSLIGKHKMSPRISPGKTWEGFFGAFFFAQGGAWAVWALAGDSLAWLAPLHVGVLGILMALAAVAGDLVESVLKRSLDVKDSGTWLPGIGGALDLIDSLCFAAPVMYFYLVLVGAGGF